MGFSRRSVLFSLAVLPAATLWAQPAGLPFLRMGVGAHAQALGGAYSAAVRDASAVSWNASALVDLPSKELFAYHQEMAGGLRYDYFAYGHPIRKGRSAQSAFGVGFGHLSKGAMDGRDEQGRATGEFGASDSVVQLAGSRRIGRRLSIGAGIKGIQSRLASYQSTGFALDMSGSYQAGPKLRFAGGVSNLGPPLKYLDNPTPLPSEIQTGVSREMLGWMTLSAGSAYGLADRRLRFGAGAEFNLAGISSLRLGYLSQFQGARAAESGTGLERWTGVSFGFGVKILRQAGFNYAFIPMGELGGSHHVDLKWRFR